MVHRIDTHDRLIAFDAPFRYFAIANGAPDLCEEWRGRSIWEASPSSEINMVFRSLVERARGGKTLTVPTRCDSPSLARFVDITLSPGPGGEVGFTSRLTRAHLKHRAALVPSAEVPMLRMCAWCFRVEDGGWRGVEDVVAEHGLLIGDTVPDVTHGVCPDCMNARLAELGAAA